MRAHRYACILVPGAALPAACSPFPSGGIVASAAASMAVLEAWAPELPSTTAGNFGIDGRELEQARGDRARLLRAADTSERIR